MNKMIFALAVGLALVGAPQVRAQPSLDFNMAAPTPGSMSYAGGTAALMGSAEVDNVVGVMGTPSHNNGTLTITGGLLSFSTGTGSGTGGWTWDGTLASPASSNFITLTGGVAGTSPALGAGSTLLSGSVLSAQVFALGGTTRAVLSVFVDHVNATLANYYGLIGGPSSQWTGSVNLTFSTSATLGHSFSTTNLGSGDAITNPAPEPSSLAIAGVGALGMIGFGLRRRKALGA